VRRYSIRRGGAQHAPFGEIARHPAVTEDGHEVIRLEFVPEQADLFQTALLTPFSGLATARGDPPHRQRGITSRANSSIERLTAAWSISPPWLK